MEEDAVIKGYSEYMKELCYGERADFIEENNLGDFY